MPVSLSDLHKPISDFFLNKFGTGANEGTAFRFDKFGSVLTDADFIDENHPERGLQQSLAVEVFSDLVNRAPMDAGDGANITLSQDAIDDIYFYRLLTPSAVAIPSDASDTAKISLTDSFNALKAAALKDWERLTLASSSGLAFTFKPSMAQPENWYDGNASQAWATQTFNVGSSKPAPTESSPPLWRFETKIGAIANELKVQPKVLLEPKTSLDRGMLLHTIRARSAVRPMIAVAPQPPVPMRSDLNPQRWQDAAKLSVNMRKVLGPHFRTMRFNDRVALNERLQQISPQAPVTTSTVSISFDYCLVNVRRPWWMDAFINHGSWQIPGVAFGEVTSGTKPGSLRWLPVAFVAVRNLTITAQWSPEDAAHLSSATDFGPFHVHSSGGQTLEHKGVQVVAWLLQTLPSLPPEKPATPKAPTEPAPVTPPQTYTVVEGDTLWRIAQKLYGDGNRYPEIQHANGIADPDKIHLGMVLLIP